MNQSLKDKIESKLDDGMKVNEIANDLGIDTKYIHQVRSEYKTGNRKVNFRCPKELYERVLSLADNKTDVIVKALEFYDSKDNIESINQPNGLIEDITWFFILFTKLDNLNALEGHLSEEERQKAIEIYQKLVQLKKKV